MSIPASMSLSAVGVVGAVNECVTLFQWAKSAIPSLYSRWSGSQEQILQDHVLQLESGLQRLRDTLPAMYDLVNKAEWRSHEPVVAKLLPNLKDAVAEAEDLLDEFGWYEKKVQVEGNASQSSFIDFFHTVVQGSFNKLNDVQLRLNHLSSQLENMGLRGVTRCFDKLVRPETTSLPNETKIFGRDKELKQLLGFLNVPTISKRKRATKTSSINASASNHVSNESRALDLPVLPIVGIGGVGKTTLAQHICSHQQVKSHFELIIWICVLDDFDVKRLTKEVIQSCTGNEATSDNLDSLQRALSNHVNNKRLLIVLDDTWDDALKENGQCWKRFCAPFRSALDGSTMLVTTRCPNVSQGVRTMEPIIVEGLKDDIFWNFFKLCAFGSEGSNSDPELEHIGKCILPKLKGSPLAAKTLGRMLSMDLQASHWNSIRESELWELKQEETDILPALRLSYMYLPFYLKQCFAFCAVYPKDYKFDKTLLVEIWAAEGLVDPQGGIPIQDIGYQYFEDLVTRSFFQKISSRYMSYQIILATGSIFGTLRSSKLILYAKNCRLESLPDGFIKLISLRKFESVGLTYYDGRRMCLGHTNKCREFTLLKNLNRFRGHLQLIDVRVLSKDHAAEADLKNKKYLHGLKLDMGKPEDHAIYYHGLYIPNNDIEVVEVLQPPLSLKSLVLKYYDSISLPSWFQPKNLTSLKSLTFECCFQLGSISPPFISRGININAIPAVAIFLCLEEVTIDGCDNISSIEHFLHPDYVPAIKKIRIKKCNMLASVATEKFGDFHFLEELEVHHCPKFCSQRLVSSSLKKLGLHSSGLFWTIDCCSLTYFHLEWEFVTSIDLEMWSLPSLRELIIRCKALASIGGSLTAFSSLRILTVIYCDKLSTLDDLLTQEYLPAIEEINIRHCHELLSLPAERFGSFSNLKHMEVLQCPSLSWQQGLALPSSLQRLSLMRCGDASPYVLNCLRNLTSLVSLNMGGCTGITSIPSDIWLGNLASLEKLVIKDCPNLVSIGGAKAVAKIKTVEISMCPKLKEAEQINKISRLSCIPSTISHICTDNYQFPVCTIVANSL
ncbi:putative disease resistance protein RGA1 [Triticum urartu]|uniref:putative disease resistance protein RGA1 n=1 Tax=Triticum urartu TaxID=4572 RepID=UPI00204406B5|nr:putative disease resistance protein RGA1 [Triticum urartu]XP_048552820.1 putative disease resistance protein RGA1 [Triticum urartu]XP_048552885.1 putative disease resistance protein RGA1 [Triticum urartu]